MVGVSVYGWIILRILFRGWELELGKVYILFISIFFSLLFYSHFYLCLIFFMSPLILVSYPYSYYYFYSILISILFLWGEYKRERGGVVVWITRHGLNRKPRFYINFRVGGGV